VTSSPIQLDLFTIARRPPAIPLARSTDGEGSHLAAARRERSGRNASSRQAVLAALALEPFAVTSKELAARHDLDRHETARRLSDLEKLGAVRKAGKREGTKEALWQPR
jgi:predicted HTH transcriptional regulator